MSAQCHLQSISISLACLVPIVVSLPRLADYFDKVRYQTNIKQSYCKPHNYRNSRFVVEQETLHKSLMLCYCCCYLQIVAARREEAAHLLPPLLDDYPQLSPNTMPSKLPYLMIDQVRLSFFFLLDRSFSNLYTDIT